MEAESERPLSQQIGKIITLLLNSAWLERLADAWKLWQKVRRGLAEEGMYEVLEYESTLELRDRHGERAVFRKREKVRYLQNRIIAYQDQAWGDGEILLNYRCSPGVPVDRYRPGQKTYVLISLREVKNRGDIDVFNIRWRIRKGFLRASEQWETEVSHRTKRLTLHVLFPRTRPPRRTLVVEGTTQKVSPLANDAHTELPDGRRLVTWETEHPRLYEQYILKWDW